MTLDDLERIYDEAKADEHNSGKRAGIRAVVAALRDEMVIDIEAEGHWNEDCAEFWFNEILGSDGVEAAGGPTSNDGRGGARVERTLLQAPAADVCE